MTKHTIEKVLSSASVTLEKAPETKHLHHVLTEHYRHHVLHFVESAHMCVGEVFNNDERLAYCESLDLDSARQYCRQIIDVRLSKQSLDNLNIKPRLDDFIKAMRSINTLIDHHVQNLLRSHIENNNQPIPIDQLKTQGGFDSTTAVFLQYAEWARLICDALAYLPPSQASGKDPYVSLVIQYEEPDIQASCGLSISLTPDIYKALAHISTL